MLIAESEHSLAILFTLLIIDVLPKKHVFTQPIMSLSWLPSGFTQPIGYLNLKGGAVVGFCPIFAGKDHGFRSRLSVNRPYKETETFLVCCSQRHMTIAIVDYRFLESSCLRIWGDWKLSQCTHTQRMIVFVQKCYPKSMSMPCFVETNMDLSLDPIAQVCLLHERFDPQRQISFLQGNIRVFCRFRPRPRHEAEEAKVPQRGWELWSVPCSCWTWNTHQLSSRLQQHQPHPTTSNQRFSRATSSTSVRTI